MTASALTRNAGPGSDGRSLLESVLRRELRELRALAGVGPRSAPDPERCLVTRAQVVRRQVDRMHADALAVLRDAVEAAELVALEREQHCISLRRRRGRGEVVSLHEHALACGAIVDALDVLDELANAWPMLLEDDAAAALGALAGAERAVHERVEARLAALGAELRLVQPVDVGGRLDLLDEHRALREVKSATFAAGRALRRIATIDAELESWCSHR